MVLMLVLKVLVDIPVVMRPAMTPFWSKTPRAAAQVDVHSPDCITCLEHWNEAVLGFLYCVARSAATL